MLEEVAIIPAVLSENLQKMARFRNLPVHMHGKVDYDKLYDLILQDLGDLRLFAHTITGLS